MTTNNDWTPAIGLRNLVAALLVRSLIASVMWGGVLYLVAPVFQRDAFFFTGRALIVLAIPPGLVIGFVLSWRLCDRSGFGGMIVAFSAIVAAAITVFMGSFAAQTLRPFASTYDLSMVCAMVGIFAVACIVKFTVLDY